MFKVGDRVELIMMPNDPCPITPGTKGTINWVGGLFQGRLQYGVKWDDGRSLGLCIPPDTVRAL